MNSDGLYPDNDLMTDEQELLVQRWLDGESTESDERDLLAFCREQPEIWQAVGTMMFEHRAWSAEVAKIYRNETVAPWLESVASDVNVDAQSNFRVPAAVNWLLGCAATLMLGLLLGQQLGSGAGNADNKELAQVGGNSKTVGQQNKSTGVEQPLELQLIVSDDSGQPRRVTVPIHRDTQIARDSLMRPGDVFSDEIVDLLRRAGYRIRQQRQVIPVDSEHSSWVVPVDSVQLLRETPQQEFQ